MENLYDETGIFEASSGEGWMSAYEASRLAPGWTVRSACEAGTGSLALFNGAPLAMGEICVMDGADGADLWTFRFNGERLRSPFPPVPAGALDGALPFRLRLAAAELRLRDLRGAEAAWMVNFGQEYRNDLDCTLLIAGMEAARGKTVVMGEQLGMRVVEVLRAGPAGEDVKATGAVLPPGAAKECKDYDFTRPDRVSRRQIEALAALHAFFLDDLRLRAPETAALFETGVVDQMTWGESLAETRAAGLLSVSLLANQTPAKRKEGSGAEARIVEGPGCARRVAQGAADYCRDRYSLRAAAPLDAAWIFAAPAAAAPDRLRAAAESLAQCWRNAGGPVLGKANAASTTEAPAYEMVLTVDYTGSSGPLLRVVYPLLFLEPYLGLLG